MIKLTILSEKLPELTSEQFKHEFREVHANQTKDVATNLGIILKYVQGLALPLVGQKSLSNLPLKEGKDCQSFAQLTWPALVVMQGSFLTEGYRNSAGKHRFANPQMIFLTEQLGQIHNIESKNADEICVVVVVQAKSECSDFEERWATHASYCLSICPKYTRNRNALESVQFSLGRNSIPAE
ncbi:hypothetical protein N7509_012694 [Penicillium cosmopolitanum]|uniref:EthD domain-containing protein n=1 Tax=Penicillium cosmopolitanum TaxID=1131564 RepID=A0A9W9SKE4_9EURO|nr:uncharacterized protein N7509_012694 [Penicillium cosmopolitanum]KAJ5379575.1 hypothetical protein N7509_012694 [Penicillium cosmopolitanum]